MYRKFIENANMLNENILTAFITAGTCEGLLTENTHNIICGNAVKRNVKNIPKADTIFNDFFTT